LFALSLSAIAAPTVSMTGTCPGPATLDVAGLTPSGTVAVLLNEQADRAFIPAGTCAGSELKLAVPGARVLTFTADPSGAFQISGDLAQRYCDDLVQVVDMTTCEASSNIVHIGHPQCDGRSLFSPPITSADVADYEVCQALDTAFFAEFSPLTPWASPTLSLPNLVHGGSLTILASGIESIELPALKTATGLSGALLDLTSLDVPLLETAGNVIFSTPLLPTLELPSLRDVAALFVTGGDASAPVLETAYEVVIRDAATSLSAPMLQTVDNYVSVESPLATEVSLPSLTTVGGAGIVDAFWVRNAASLTSLDIRSLSSVAEIAIEDNALLCPEDGLGTWPSWAAVTGVTSLSIRDNAPGCYESPVP
jgi:hypothetical protein